MKRNEDEIMNEFLNLACNLSPENLTCDGELSKKEVQRRLNQINSSWKHLEKEIGKTVTEDDAWNWHAQKSKSNNSPKY